MENNRIPQEIIDILSAKISDASRTRCRQLINDYTNAIINMLNNPPVDREKLYQYRRIHDYLSEKIGL